MARKKSLDNQFRNLIEEIDLERFRDSVKSNFADFPDPRKTSQCLFPAWYLILILLCGYLAGCNVSVKRSHVVENTAIAYAMPASDLEGARLVSVRCDS